MWAVGHLSFAGWLGNTLYFLLLKLNEIFLKSHPHFLNYLKFPTCVVIFASLYTGTGAALVQLDTTPQNALLCLFFTYLNMDFLIVMNLQAKHTLVFEDLVL